MGRLLFFIVALIAVILAVLVVAPGVVPVAAYKGQIETAASNAIGREVTIGDDLSFRIIPRTAFHVTDLTIANENGFEGDYLAQVEEADIGVKLLKLIFSSSVEIDRFVLTEPDITLARKANGEVNWNLANTSAADENAPADSESSVRDIRLGDVRIVDGSARFTDAAANATYTANDIDVQVILSSLAEPLEVNGTMIFQGAPSRIDLVLASLADVMDNEPSNLKLDLQIGEASAGADLTVETKDGLRYSGPVQIDAPDLPAFAALTGTQIADAPGFDKLAMAGNIDGGDASFRLSDARIDFDDIAAQGALTLDWSGERPRASGVLSTNELDLRRYLPPPAQNAEGFPEWSSEPMDFTSLRNIDADFDISTDNIFLNDLKIGESRLKMALINGRMTADIPELSMYGGQGSGRLVVNARGATPSFSGNFDMAAVQAEPMSLDLLKHDNLLGLGSFTFDFTATGASQAAIMSSLDGSGGFDIADGLIKGVNLGKIVRAASDLRQGFNPAALQTIVATARGPAETTDFSEFLSDFTITDGLMNAPTISLNGKYLTMTGNGSINLPAQTIDLRLSPRATASTDGGETTRSVAIPVRIGGTFSQPTVGLDPEALTRLLAGGVLQQVLGGGRDSNEEGDPATPEDAARGLIEGILGGSGDDNSNDQQDASGDASETETIANDALNALFGRKKAPAEETASEDENPDQ
ncbi:MAG: AsmA family protein [Pseudomonadota bacterium]